MLANTNLNLRALEQLLESPAGRDQGGGRYRLHQ